MSYGAEFVTADPAGAPLDPPILVGADPVLWMALALLLLAAGLFGWWLGVRSGSREGDATPAIWKAIDGAAKEAMKADDHALRGRAQQLLETIDRRLGRTLAVAGTDRGLADRVGDLRAAVDGRPSHGHGGGHGAHDASHDSHAPGDHHKDPASDDHGGAAPRASAIASAITINVSGGPAQGGGHDPHHPPRSEMTAREQTDALRLAVAAFNEHWRHEARRVGELRGALTELTGSTGRGVRTGVH
jgi:hypothetical protein